MFILLEGLDKQGKTSLAAHIASKFGLKLKKFSKPEGDPYIEYMTFLLEQSDEPKILDRFYLGELAYGPVKRGKSGLNDWQVRNIEMTLLMRQSLNIYCFTSERETAKNFQKDKEEYATLKDIKPLMMSFENAKDNSLLKWFTYNYLEDPDYKNVDQLITAWWNMIQDHLKLIRFNSYSRTLGNFFANTLVLGEISNVELEQAKYKSVNVPFANGPSAEILYEALGDNKLDVAITNIIKAHEPDSYKYRGIEDELKMPNLRKIICLGNRTYDILTTLYPNASSRFEIIKTFHPSYVARGGMSIKDYKKEISTII